MEKKILISVRVNKAVYERLKEYKRISGRSIGWMIGNALETAISLEEKRK